MNRVLMRRDRIETPSKVAAVCYRYAAGSLQFLLVRTSSGKWTFPKGNIEPDLTLHGSAQLEAFEEAGAIGDIAKASFDAYLHPKGAGGPNAGTVVLAYLLEVRRTVQPEHPGRRPTWFHPHEAKARLSQRRRKLSQREFARVIDRAADVLAKSRSRSPLVPPVRQLRSAS